VTIGMRPDRSWEIRRAAEGDRARLVALLAEVDLLTHDVLAPDTAYWVAEGPYRQLVGAAGVELGAAAALLRSVAVLPAHRGQGLAQALIAEALRYVQAQGRRRVYLFSTRSGAYWQRLGFRNVPVAELAADLPGCPQVLRFAAIGKLAVEVAWRADL
jgi:N-acetylglutamate synthase-like GNAT family acetyltransferase